MKRLFKQQSLLVENRFVWASVVVLFVTCGLIMRLWYLQVYRGDHYKELAENNRIRRIEIPAPRGMIYDRNGQIILGNRPFFDLIYIPQYVKDKETTFNILSRLLHTPVTAFEQRLRLSQGRPRFLPIILKRNLSIHEVSTIETNKIFLPGIDISTAPRRDYKPGTPAHLVGYLGEIDDKTLTEYNDKTGDNPYLPGDLVGKHGLESRWEPYLRGKRGYRFIQVDAFGRQAADNLSRSLPQLPSVPAVPGADLVLTIDRDLQTVATDAFKGKHGAVVALNPNNGQILAMVSSPGFDPAEYQEGIKAEEWRALMADPFHPMLDKTTGGEFPPGSVYKAVVAIAGIEEGIITPNTTFFCPGYYRVGSQVFHCHDRAGDGDVNVFKALIKSCDVFFYHVGVELGVDRIAKYAKALGLGDRLGVNLNMERPGLIPTSAWKKLTTHFPWAPGETPPVAIGQGYDLLTPMQMANLYATIANGGTVFRPYVVQRVVDNVGKTLLEQNPQVIKKVDIVKPTTFALLRDALLQVVEDPHGTGKRARVPGHTVAGKTGTAQSVSLKRNRNSTNVSALWREHAMFASFSPAEHAEIAVAVVSEHDDVIGGGGKTAAPVAGAVIRAYWELKDKRAGIALREPPKQETSVEKR